MQLSQNGKYIIIISRQNEIQVWDFPQCKLLYTVSLLNEEPVRFINFAISPNEKYLAITKDTYLNVNNPKIQIYDLATGGILHTLEGHQKKIGTMAFSQDSKTLASSAQYEPGTYVYLWDVENGNLKK